MLACAAAAAAAAAAAWVVVGVLGVVVQRAAGSLVRDWHASSRGHVRCGGVMYMQWC
jgi:hypothetical protein